MSFKDNPGVALLKEALADFTTKHRQSLSQVFAAVSRGVGDAGRNFKLGQPKEEQINKILDAVEEQLSAAYVEEVVTDLYELIQGRKTTEGLARIAQGLDVSQVEDALFKFTGKLKDPQVNRQIAEIVKQIADKNVANELTTSLKASIDKSGLPPIAQSLARAQIDQLGDFVKSAKDLSVNEIGDRIAAVADSLPVEMLSMTLYGAMANFTPESIGELLKSKTQSLPSPRQVGMMYSQAFNQARQKITGASKPSNDDVPGPRPKRQPPKDGGTQFKFGGKKK